MKHVSKQQAPVSVEKARCNDVQSDQRGRKVRRGRRPIENVRAQYVNRLLGSPSVLHEPVRDKQR